LLIALTKKTCTICITLYYAVAPAVPPVSFNFKTLKQFMSYKGHNYVYVSHHTHLIMYYLYKFNDLGLNSVVVS